MSNQNKMLEGWYCRTMANEQAAASSQPGDSDEDSQDQDGVPVHQNTDYKAQYRYLKQKLKFLIYENESFQDALRSSQRRLLKVSRDRSFLLDRLLQYEKPSSSETDETESSADESRNEPKKRKTDSSVSGNTSSVRGRKRKNILQRQARPQDNSVQNHNNSNNVKMVEGHMTAEEVERHLQSRQSITELVPERASATVPNEMFSNEPSLDSESNDQMVETSPSIIGED